MKKGKKQRKFHKEAQNPLGASIFLSTQTCANGGRENIIKKTAFLLHSNLNFHQILGLGDKTSGIDSLSFLQTREMSRPKTFKYFF